MNWINPRGRTSAVAGVGPEALQIQRLHLRPEEKSGGIALLGAGLLTLLAVGCGSLGYGAWAPTSSGPMTLSFKTDFYRIGRCGSAPQPGRICKLALTRYARWHAGMKRDFAAGTF